MDAAEDREKDEEEIAHADNDCSDDSLEEGGGGEDEEEEEEKFCSEVYLAFDFVFRASHDQFLLHLGSNSSYSDFGILVLLDPSSVIKCSTYHYCDQIPLREPLTEEEIEVLIAELLEVESKAADAQEALEEESLMKVEADVRKELALSLSDNELEKAVVEEMFTFKEVWEVELDELETESAYLLVGPDILVCDEAHIIKNTKADTTQALKQVKCQRRIALTGSPLQNNLMDFQNPIENGQHTSSTVEDVKIMNQRSHILYEQLKGFVQRMDTSVVKKDLPPKTVFVIAVKLSPLQRELYKRFLDVHGFTKDKASGEKILKRSFFAGYQALAQIWNHPGILQLVKENKDSGKFEDVEKCLPDDSSSDENLDYNMISGEKLGNPHRKFGNAFVYLDWWRDFLQDNTYKEVNYSGKMVLLLDILTMCSNMGDKALVFSQSLLTLDLIEFYLSKLPCPTKNGKCWKKRKDWYRLDGRTESSERQKLVERFNDPLNRRVKCTLISTRAGSLGINLHAANRVIIVDGSWNPTYDLQAIFRVWRYGQTKPVFAYRLLAHGTMEEKIYKRQVTKEGLAARVVDRQQVHRTMSKEEILHLFEFGDDEKADVMHELGQEQEVVAKPNIGNLLKPELPHPHGTSSDNLFEMLISRHHVSWISNYHEHDTLLQENEDEKLSKEEQDLAWELYLRTLKWEESKRVHQDETILDQPKISVDASASRQQQRLVATTTVNQKPAPPVPESDALGRARHHHQNHYVQRKCTNLSHLLTLRSQGTKMGCSTICGECAQEIRWEDINRNGKLVK
ncbi:UNVERIFIED_CONTAM: protein CHROMATIN REMODELING 20 [Sesamum radiatum]|uniref:Protein CHROMATIN REMODELING 20 n=1 Tax=Sesamum radiatum TaxID=300843 RepID=A0AAW2TEY0_SESRA